MRAKDAAPVVTDHDVDRAATLLSARAGFRHDPLLVGRLARCLQDAALESGQAVGAYLAALPDDAHALQRLVDRVTIQESQFFRDEGQFATLAQEVLPALPAGLIWSAGCANGQEAWSLAITLLESGRTDCTILATDISTAALRRAEEGRYPARELRGLSPARRDRWFVAGKGGFEVGPEARRLVRFAHHNLATGSLPFRSGQCRLVFCRNVMIYFSDDEISSLLARIGAGLDPGGLLFLGYSESLSWLRSTPFERILLGGSFVYRVTAADRPPPASRRTAPSTPRRTARAKPAPATAAAALADPVLADPVLADPGRAGPFLLEGQEALATGDAAHAVRAFRKAAYLRPGDATVSLHLAFALDALGDTDAARRWFRLAQDAIVASDTAHPVLEGWSADELTRLLERKLSTQREDQR
ncbi:MAG: chemotaxis protein methyltransferase CheR [Actinomycetota bacterium]|nr:chemotaxis protein methyltransferase CheR [Actinomycetota bacterium]